MFTQGLTCIPPRMKKRILSFNPNIDNLDSPNFLDHSEDAKIKRAFQGFKEVDLDTSYEVPCRISEL